MRQTPALALLPALLAALLVGSPPVHAEDAPPILVEVSLVKAAPGRGAKALFGEGRMRGGHALEREDAGRLATALSPGQGLTLVSAPSVVVTAGETATVDVKSQQAYVRTYEVVRAGDVVIADPLVDTLETGLSLEVRPRLARDGRITLEGRVRFAALAKPIPHRKVVAEGTEHLVEVETPEVLTSDIAFAFTLADGGRAVVTGLQTLEQETPEAFVLLAVRRAAGAEAPTPPTGEERLLLVEARILDVRPDVAAALLPSPGADGAQVAFLESEDAARLVRRPAAEVEVLTAPRLTVLDGQRANVSILSDVSYVQDFEVEVTSGGQIATPIVATVKEGVVLDVEPSLDAEGHVRLVATVTVSDVARPIPEMKTRIGEKGPEVTIQLPEVRVARSRFDVRLPHGAAALVGGLGTGKLGPRLVLLEARPLASGTGR
jgi:hypothetical protein